MPTRLLALLAAAALTLAGAGGGAAAQEQDQDPDSGGPRFGIRLLDAPVERADDPRAQQYVVDHVSPGARIERRVEVSNDTGAELTVALYAGAASIDGGEFHFGDDRAANELTEWTTVSPSSLTLAPGERTPATVTIAVPGDASGGERYGVVWAEAVADEGDVTRVNRVGVRVYLSVGGAEEPESDLEIVSLTAERDADGRPLVRIRVDNTGGRALDLRGELTLDEGPGGLTAGPFPIELGTSLAPGQSGEGVVILDPSLPVGPWHAVATVASGRLERSAEATITFPDERSRAAPPVPATSLASEGSDLLRIGLAAGVSFLTLGGVLLLLWSRRRRRPSPTN